jgi:hypothetical protein
MEQFNNYSPFSVGIETGNGITDECNSVLTGFSDDHVDDQVRAGDREVSLVEDPGLMNAIEKTERDVSNFCTSVRTEADYNIRTTKWKAPLYKDKMIGVCGMIESQCLTHLSVPTIITHIADWFLFRSGTPLCPLSVKVKMKDMDEIRFNPCFVPCYDAMKELYELEMEKERKTNQQKFEDYFEDLIESWAIVDMTVTMLVNEEDRGDFISVRDLLEFAPTRVRLLSNVERLLLHHFKDPHSGGEKIWQVCKYDKGRVTKDETQFLVKYRKIMQTSGDDQYNEAVSGADGHIHDNTNRDLLLRLMSIQKLHRDTARSSKRKSGFISPPLPPPSSSLSPVPPAITDDAESDKDDINEDIGFIGRLHFFLDPALIARIKNPTADADMIEWERRFQLVKEAYQRKKGPMDC